jgi:hypothetical protein
MLGQKWKGIELYSFPMLSMYNVSQKYGNINGLFSSWRQTYAMGDRLTLEQWRMAASLMEVYGSPPVVSQKFAEPSAGQDSRI